MDFNILRNPSEKNNDRFNARWPFLFNAIIDGLDLRELEMSGRKYTWANSVKNQIFEKTRQLAQSGSSIFLKLQWLPLVGKISDHTPLLLNFGEGEVSRNTTTYRNNL